MANIHSAPPVPSRPAPDCRRIRVYFIDDDPSVLNTLGAITRRERDVAVVGMQTSAEAAIREVVERKPQVVVTDLRMGELSGIDCARRLKMMLPTIKILIYTAFSEQTNIVESFRAGVDGYLIKPNSTSQLAVSIRRVFQGQPVIADPALALLLLSLRDAPHPSLKGPLSPRESDVMEMIRLSKRDKEIAQELHMTETTVHTHTRRIYGKLGVHNWKDAVEAYAGSLRSAHPIHNDPSHRV